MKLVSCCTFQFHKGAIRTTGWGKRDDEDDYFNSIKVRLEHGDDAVGSLELLVFQFHKGAIRTD